MQKDLTKTMIYTNKINQTWKDQQKQPNHVRRLILLLVGGVLLTIIRLSY